MVTYVNGDATAPRGTDPALIVHVCNDRGGWGAGFVLALSKRWKTPEQEYRQWYRGTTSSPFDLGEIQVVQVDPRPIYVANMLAQVGYGPKNERRHRVDEFDGEIPLKYEALESCLSKVATVAQTHGASVHMPRIGCALAGGRWSKVEPIIQQTLKDLSVTVYDFGPYNP